MQSPRIESIPRSRHALGLVVLPMMIAAGAAAEPTSPPEVITLANVVDPGRITADEPMAEEFSSVKAARYLDTASLHWQKSRKCAACHTLHHRAMIAWVSCYIDDLTDDEQREKTLRELLAIQRPDGGWSTPGLLADWEGLQRLDGKPHDPNSSDAYATGFTIVVARELGTPSSELRRGVDWLLANQRASGKWFCRSPAKDSRHYFANFGSAFAVLALQSCGKLPGWPLSKKKSNGNLR